MENQHTPAHFEYLKELQHYYRALWQRHCTVDVVSPDADLTPYALVLAPLFLLVSAEQGTRIERVEEFDPLPAGKSNTLVSSPSQEDWDGSYGCDHWCDIVHLEGAQALSVSGALALGSPLLALLEAEAATTFIKGADISWLPQMEAHGYTFYNASGVKQDLLTILKGYGLNAIRLCTFVNPSSDPANGHCSQAETIAMAVRCKNAGYKVDIDFHFGDTWNSVGKQVPPAAWAHLSYSQMLTAMHNYVSGFMAALKASKVTPDWVQIGNEENKGICLPTGSLSSQPAQMTGLLNTAYDAVKATFSSTPVIIHLAQPQNLSVVEHFLDTYKAHGGKWDNIYVTG